MVGIVILNYNSPGDTIACINSVREFCHPGDYALCVVDNGSDRETIDAVGAVLLEGDKYVLSGENIGYARGNNLALKYFDAVDGVDKVLILNNDVLLTQDILTPLAAYLDTHPACGVVSPLLRGKDGAIDHSCARRFKSPRDMAIKAGALGRFGVKTGEFILRDNPALAFQKELRIDLPSGSCMMLRKKDFAAIGWFDPATFLYFEEDILGTRLARAGFMATLLPGISATHLGAGTTSRQSSAKIYGYWRQSLLYYIEHYTDCSDALLRYIRCRTALGSLSKK